MVRTDIMHRQAAPVKANEASISPKAIRGGGKKAQLREALRVSDAYLALSLRAARVFDALLDHAGNFSTDEIGREMMHCWPSRKTLAKRVGRSEDFIDRGLAELRKAGLVVSVNRGGWTGKRNVYTIFIPAGTIRERVDEAIAEAQTAQNCGNKARTSAASNAAELRDSLEPCIENHEKRTTTTETRHAQPALTASTVAAPGGGGGVSSQSTEEAKAEARKILQSWGVAKWPNVMQRLEQGEIAVQDIIETREYLCEQIDIGIQQGRLKDYGGGLFYQMLFDPCYVEGRRVWAEERRAANAMREAANARQQAREKAEREAAAKRHRLVNVVAAAGVEADRRMSELTNKPEAVEKIQKNKELIGRELGSTAEAIVDRLSESHRVEIADDPEPWRVFKRLANIAKDIESERAQAQAMRAEFKNRTAQGVAQ